MATPWGRGGFVQLKYRGQVVCKLPQFVRAVTVTVANPAILSVGRTCTPRPDLSLGREASRGARHAGVQRTRGIIPELAPAREAAIVQAHKAVLDCVPVILDLNHCMGLLRARLGPESECTDDASAWAVYAWAAVPVRTWCTVKGGGMAAGGRAPLPSCPLPQHPPTSSCAGAAAHGRRLCRHAPSDMPPALVSLLLLVFDTLRLLNVRRAQAGIMLRLLPAWVGDSSDSGASESPSPPPLTTCGPGRGRAMGYGSGC